MRDRPVDYERPQTQDERLDEFYLWAGIEQRPRVSRGLRILAFSTAAVGSLVIAIAAAGWV